MQLSEDDQMWLARWTVGPDRQPGMDWLAGNPPAEKVHAALVKWLDRGGPATVFARVLSAHLGTDPDRVYAENWPRKAARLAEDCRARGDNPHADNLQRALVALMFCANCGRPLGDPVSVERGIGPDCWERIDPQWKRAIVQRVSGPDMLPEAS